MKGLLTSLMIDGRDRNKNSEILVRTSDFDDLLMRPRRIQRLEGKLGKVFHSFCI